MSRPDSGHVTVSVVDGVLEIRMPVEVISSLAGVKTSASDKSLRARLPKFGPELADGFATQLAEPQPSREPQRIRIVRLALTRVEVIGQTVVELAEPVEVYT